MARMGIEIQLLGPVRIIRDGEEMPAGGPAQRALLAILALQPNRSLSRASLVDRLWGYAAPETAGHALEVHVSTLRKTTDPGAARGTHKVLASTPEGYLLAVGEDAVDAARLERLLLRMRQLRRNGDFAGLATLGKEALGLRHGRALSGLEGFDFHQPEAARLDSLCVAAAELRAEADYSRGDFTGLTAWLAPLVGESPATEPLTAWLMRAMSAGGDSAAALAAYHRLRRRLADELGVSPDHVVLRLAEDITNSRLAIGTRSQAGSAVVPATTLFIGRTSERSVVASLVSGSRLVTLTGFPGVGKTRLSFEVAADVRESFGDVYLVDLADIADAKALIPALSRVIGLEEHAVRLADVLRAFLATHDCLVVLDNCEHLLPDLGAEVMALLEMAQGLRVLATSVAPIGIRGEVIFQVPPLALPASSSDDDMSRSEAVALLSDRLLAADPGFVIDNAKREAMFRICTRLDGVPLAIEVAAAYSRVVDLEELNRLLEDDIAVVTAADPTAVGARRSVQRALATSYAGLSPMERRLLDAATVFRGPLNVDSLLAVARVPGATAAEHLAAINGLVDHALLVRGPGQTAGTVRILESVRRFVEGRLSKTPSAGPELRKRYWNYFATLCEEMVPMMEAPGQIQAIARLDAEIDNVREALRWLLDGNGPDRAVYITGGLARMWWCRGHLTEARRWIREALEMTTGDTVPRAEALVILAYMEWSQGDFEAALGHCDDALAMSRRAGNARMIIRALYYRGIALHECGRFAEERVDLRAAVKMARKHGEGLLEGLILDMLARSLKSAGRHSWGRHLNERALKLLRSIGDDFSIAVSLVNLGESLEGDGELQAAGAAYRDAYQTFARLHSVVGEGYALQGMAAVAAVLGRFDDVARNIAAMEMRWEKVGFAPTIEDVGRIAGVRAAAIEKLGKSRYEELTADSRSSGHGSIDGILTAP